MNTVFFTLIINKLLSGHFDNVACCMDRVPAYGVQEAMTNFKILRLFSFQTLLT